MTTIHNAAVRTARDALLRALSAEYEQAQAEEDKGFMTKDATLEARANGKVMGLRTAVRLVAGLENDAEAAALLDVLDGGE